MYSLRIKILAGFIAAAGIVSLAMADDALLSTVLQSKTADAAWTELNDSAHPPASPPEWRTNAPPLEEQQKFYLPYIHALADRAKDFYTRFPQDKHATDTKLLELNFLLKTVAWGGDDQKPRLESVENSLLKDPAVPTADHLNIAWAMAQDASPDKARSLLNEITNSAVAPPRMKEAAMAMLAQLDQEKLVGRPIELQFTAVDGRSVDLAALKGKVVLLDFWATWCGPCVGEVPNVKKTYDQFHDKGFEIVGISLDKDKDTLTRFTADHHMEWPQYFDGQYWQNKYARQFGVESIPSMWLIDKKGILRNMRAREDLAGGVQKLLAE